MVKRGEPVAICVRETALMHMVVDGFTAKKAVSLSRNHFSERSAKRWLERWRKYNHVKAFPRLGKSFGWSVPEQNLIRAYIDSHEHVDTYLDELAEAIQVLVGRPVTESGVWHLLARMGYTRKILSKVSHARSEVERMRFAQHMRASNYQMEQLVFFDESGTCDRDCQGISATVSGVCVRVCMMSQVRDHCVPGLRMHVSLRACA